MKDDGLVNYLHILVTPERASTWARMNMAKFFAGETGAIHFSKDPSYYWAEEVRRKRHDTATRLQNRGRA